MDTTTKLRERRTAVSRGVNPLLLDRYSRLSCIDFDDLTRIAEASEYQLVPRGNVIYRQDDPADGVYVVLDGAVRLERRSRESIVDAYDACVYATFGDGALLGEIDRRYSAVAEAAATLVKMPLQPLQEVLWSYPSLAGDWTFDIMTRVSRRAPFRRSGEVLRDIYEAFAAA